MNLDDLEKKLNSFSEELKKDPIKEITGNLLKQDLNYEQRIDVENIHYANESKHEKLYQQKNREYKHLISNFSEAYLEMSDFYVGPELPREHYLQSKEDVKKLYLMFAFYALAEPYIEAYDKKFNG
jgi:hypothetical protein